MLLIAFLIHTALSFPVIGIVSQPSLIPGFRQYNYIAASYVKMLETSGAQVAHIPFDSPLETLKLIFNNINGLLIPGGATALEGDSVFCSVYQTYTAQVSYLLRKALRRNDKGTYFPVMGICLGHELIHYFFSGFSKNYKVPVFGQAMVIKPLLIVGESPVYNTFNTHLRQISVSEPIYYYHHKFAISPEIYEISTVNQNLTIVAIDEDSRGTLFVSAALGITYPILTSQYHPEKNPFEWTVPANHSADAIKISQIHGNVFVDMARKNTHVFTINEYLIYNYQTVIPSNEAYDEVYLFRKH